MWEGSSSTFGEVGCLGATLLVLFMVGAVGLLFYFIIFHMLPL
jgi:hypothetical protein